MPPTEGTKIIRVILPNSSEIRAYFDRSTSPGNWRDADTDDVVTAWTDGLIVRATTVDGYDVPVYWNAQEEWAWQGVDDDPSDTPLSQSEIAAIASVDLRQV